MPCDWKMSRKWQKRFLTWGILIAVFFFDSYYDTIIYGGTWKVGVLAVILDVKQYTHYLEIAHIPLVSFGGTF